MKLFGRKRAPPAVPAPSLPQPPSPSKPAASTHSTSSQPHSPPPSTAHNASLGDSWAVHASAEVMKEGPGGTQASSSQPCTTSGTALSTQQRDEACRAAQQEGPCNPHTRSQAPSAPPPLSTQGNQGQPAKPPVKPGGYSPAAWAAPAPASCLATPTPRLSGWAADSQPSPATPHWAHKPLPEIQMVWPLCISCSGGGLAAPWVAVRLAGGDPADQGGAPSTPQGPAALGLMRISGCGSDGGTSEAGDGAHWMPGRRPCTRGACVCV